MSFEVTYNGDIQYIKIFYSTEETKVGKYYGEFYNKMDSLASDLKRLKKELDEAKAEIKSLKSDLTDRVGILERWRWFILGGALVLGYILAKNLPIFLAAIAN